MLGCQRCQEKRCSQKRRVFKRFLKTRERYSSSDCVWLVPPSGTKHENSLDSYFLVCRDLLTLIESKRISADRLKVAPLANISDLSLILGAIWSQWRWMSSRLRFALLDRLKTTQFWTIRKSFTVHELRPAGRDEHRLYNNWVAY